MSHQCHSQTRHLLFAFAHHCHSHNAVTRNIDVTRVLLAPASFAQVPNASIFTHPTVVHIDVTCTALGRHRVVGRLICHQSYTVTLRLVNQGLESITFEKGSST
eukprot:Blabericola_migrator_1__7930@NODE_4062_length_1353_cov_55_405910_g2508_i0_p3_GENE_NODE_4062_length_1353_cov_55_405910_g2508_i0NODE_4062_length_1353_cov_55_405910_g2508_i0_p3_ORF_typecomplete_len104_score11_46Ribosomal_S8e/PF01201_22/0_18_NODE_4062_length_1353_cov_55_405910_g2508_i09831294